MPSREHKPNRNMLKIEGRLYDLPGSNGWKMFEENELTDILTGVSSFAYRPTVHSPIHCTVRAEQRQRGGSYWVAYRRANKRLSKVYVGKVGQITLDDLREAANELDRRVNLAKRPPVKLTPPLYKALALASEHGKIRNRKALMDDCPTAHLSTLNKLKDMGLLEQIYGYTLPSDLSFVAEFVPTEAGRQALASEVTQL